MTPELQALARRAVACKGWRWMPGMKIHDRTLDIRVFALLSDGLHVASTDSRGGFVHSMSLNHPVGLPIPDLTDPATLGCLLTLVREAHSGKIVITVGKGWWRVELDSIEWEGEERAALIAALVASLEAAP